MTPASPADPVADVTVDAIAAGGDGVARLDDGRVVFVPRAAPGDRASIRVVQERGRWCRGEIERLDRASPLRRAAPCPLYAACGGCQLQHLGYRAQLEAKARIVGDALRRIGGLDVEDPPVEPAPDEFRYRNRVSFTLKRLRGGRVVAGFHHRARPGRIVEVDGECLLPEEGVGRVWSGLRRGWGPGASRLPPGPELRLTLRRAEGGALLAMEGGGEGGDPETLLDAVPGLRAVWHRPDGGAWRRLAGEDPCHDVVGGHRVRLAPGAFSQVNREMGESLHRSVLGEMGRVPGLRIVDAYCGVGVHGRRLAAHGARVVGLELDPAAAAVAREDAPDGFTVVEGPTEETLAGALPADRVILNPPRGGLHPRVPEVLREARPPRLVYVSCDPATLARDLGRLVPAFRLRRVRAFDLFPQTSHVETVVTLDADADTGDP